MQLDERLFEELSAIAEAQDCELLHASFAGGVLKLILDRPDEDVNLAHCEKVSRQASALLDVLEFGNGNYTLEVSSPGLDRQLYSPRDYERFVGRLARVRFRTPEAVQTVVGRIEEFRPAGPTEDGAAQDEVTIAETVTQKAGHKGGKTREQVLRRHVVPLAAIETARLEVEL